MNIKPLKSYWVCVDPSGWAYQHSISGTRTNSIKYYSKHWDMSWRQIKKKHGIRCIKVNIQFTEVK